MGLKPSETHTRVIIYQSPDLVDTNYDYTLDWIKLGLLVKRYISKIGKLLL
jgi:hypothetical protein